MARRSLIAFVVVSTLLTAAPSLAAGATPTRDGLAGNVTPALDPAPAGTVAVVASSAPNDGRVAVIVENATDGPVNNVRVDATATRADGGAVTSASTATVVPGTLAPGAYGLASLDFRQQGLAPGAAVTYAVKSTTAASGTDPKLLEVSNVSRSAPLTGKVAQQVTFTVSNATRRAMRGPITGTVMCFNEAAKPVNLTTATVRRAGLGAGKHAQVTMRLTELCPTSLVAARSA